MEPQSLDGYLILSKWNRQLKVASEEIQTTCLDLASLTSEKARVLRRTFSTLRTELGTVFSSIEKIESKLTRLSEFANIHLVEKVLAKAGSFVIELDAWLPWLGAEAKNQVSLAEVIVGCEAVLERADLKRAIENNNEVQTLLGDLLSVWKRMFQGHWEALVFGQGLDNLNLSAQIKARLRSQSPPQSG